MPIFDVNLEILPFDDIMAYAKDSGYAPLNLCNNNNACLELSSDDVTARIMVRDNSMGWRVLATFEIESWAGNHWSDIDVDNAIYNDSALMSLA